MFRAWHSDIYDSVAPGSQWGWYVCRGISWPGLLFLLELALVAMREMECVHEQLWSERSAPLSPGQHRRAIADSGLQSRANTGAVCKVSKVKIEFEKRQTPELSPVRTLLG